MPHARPSAWLALAVSLALPPLLGAQEKPAIRDLTDSDVTNQDLIDILQPPEDSARRITVGQRHEGRAHCEKVHGATARPVSEIPALRIHFATGQSRILPEARPTLDALGKALTSDELSAYCFQIQGFTDDRGADGLNQRLSELRAAAVVRYLVENFPLGADRIQTAGFGKRDPIADNRTDLGRAKNRRVQIVNLGSGSEDP